MSEEVDFTRVREGDRIEVTHTLRGVVLENRDCYMNVRDASGAVTAVPRPGIMRWEQTIEHIEAEYVADAVYESACGMIYVYDPRNLAKPWRVANTAKRMDFDTPYRPMKRLKGDGE